MIFWLTLITDVAAKLRVILPVSRLLTTLAKILLDATVGVGSPKLVSTAPISPPI